MQGDLLLLVGVDLRQPPYGRVHHGGLRRFFGGLDACERLFSHFLEDVFDRDD